MGERSHRCCSLRQTLMFKNIDVLLGSSGGLSESRTNRCGGGANDRGCQVYKVSDELVRVLRLDPVGFKLDRGEIFEVLGNDHVSAGNDRRRQYVAIVVIRQLKRWYEPLIPFDQAIANVCVHELAGSLDLIGCKIRAIRRDVAHPFRMNVLGPVCAK